MIHAIDGGKRYVRPGGLHPDIPSNRRFKMPTCDNCGGNIIFNEDTGLVDCENRCGNTFGLNDPSTYDDYFSEHEESGLTDE